MTWKALVVQEGVIKPVEIEDHRDIHNLIGNWFTVCFNINSPERAGIWLTGYCDDEFLLKENPLFNVVLEAGTLYQDPYPIGGPIVITATTSRNGETTSIMPDEVKRFFVDHRMGMMSSAGIVPTLRFRRS